MVSDEIGKRLHDRATRGETLSAQDQARLDAWYADQDRTEAVELGLNTAPKTMATLQAQVDSALAQLASVTARIQEIAEENDALRREVASLRSQLAQHALLQTA